jgi:hypothetical protein
LRISRRKLLAQSAKIIPTASLLGSASGLLASPEPSATPAKKLKVVVTGGHPGDPEFGCGGTIARYTDADHEAVLLYLNRGEGNCGANDPNDCAKIRTSEPVRS